MPAWLSLPACFFGRIFVVPKASGGWRPVLDLSLLSEYLQYKPFCMETPTSIRDSIRQGDWAFSIDLTDAYFHILIHPRDRKWLRFSWDGKSFQFRALPFGLAPAPWVFTRVVRELCLALRSKGIRLRVYLDDWLILAESRALCQHHLNLVRNQCQSLGFLMNAEKSELEPSQQFEFLDASNMGWGAHMDNHTASGTWNPQQQSWHINRLELEAVFLALQHFLPHVPHRWISSPQGSTSASQHVSPISDPQAWAIDALSISWSNLLGYAFPPFPIMGKVLRKARLESATLILIAPHWPAQPWFPDLLHLTRVPPLRLHIGRRSLVQPRSGIPHGNLEVLNLHAWLLCGNLCQH
ncbi:uncharacterized protein LOC143286671 [Babylonia areolata]|uniref:uncharacterized protein LOC143286671 n=1 Tax=Babylonia areolata TaxID=304850 RepID=UPI003FD03428